MGLLDKILRKTSDEGNTPTVKLGRFTDAFKSPTQMQAIEDGRLAWEQQQYFQALRYTLDYLTEEEQQNVEIIGADDPFICQLHQGSRTINNTYKKSDGLYAAARIAKIDEYSIGYLRNLVERNFRLSYCKYVLTPEDEIRLTLFIPEEGLHPDRIITGLKELALHADKMDDLLVEEFNSLSPITEKHITNLPELEVAAKLQYYYYAIEEAIRGISFIRLSPAQRLIIQKYIGLELIYRLEYLISPEGKTRDQLERIHHTFFDQSSRNDARRINDLWAEIEHLSTRTISALEKELYNVSTTFGLTAETSISDFKSFLDEHWNVLLNYTSKRNHRWAEVICDFIVGYALFNFGLPEFIRSLLEFYYRVRAYDFFKKLGYDTRLRDEQGMVTAEAQSLLKNILSRNNINEKLINTLNTEHISVYKISYIRMLRELL